MDIDNASKLTQVAQGIIDAAASEWRDANLATIESVQAYAEHGCGVHLTDKEAARVRTACLAWIVDDSGEGAKVFDAALS